MMLSADVEFERVKKLFPTISDSEAHNIANVLIRNNELYEDFEIALKTGSKTARDNVALQFGLIDDPNIGLREDGTSY